MGQISGRFYDDDFDQRIVWAYMHKKYNSVFGLLEAVDSEDAQRHLGGKFYKKRISLSSEAHNDSMFDRQAKFNIVWPMFKSRFPDTPEQVDAAFNLINASRDEDSARFAADCVRSW